MIDCRVLLQHDILTLETGWIRRQCRWNNGRLISLRIEQVVCARSPRSVHFLRPGGGRLPVSPRRQIVGPPPSIALSAVR